MKIKHGFDKSSTTSEGVSENGPKYCFHCLFGEEFKADTAEEIIGQLYESSKRGLPDLSFKDWWAYQNRNWRGLFPLDLPEAGDEKVFQKMLTTFVKAGALEIGPYPSRQQRGFNV